MLSKQDLKSVYAREWLCFQCFGTVIVVYKPGSGRIKILFSHPPSFPTHYNVDSPSYERNAAHNLLSVIYEAPTRYARQTYTGHKFDGMLTEVKAPFIFVGKNFCACYVN